MDNMDLQDFIVNLNEVLDLDINYNPVDDTFGMINNGDVSIFQDVKDFSLVIKDKISKKYNEK